MPKRLLDDSLLTSTSIAKCSPRAQDAWPRFILLADDFGCFEVIPRALAARGWVYRQDVTDADMVPWLEEYVGAGMACLWTVNERRYCYLTGWEGEHGQRRRAEYDPNAPKGTPGFHGSRRRTPRPPADLVEAVRAGLRRDRDGLPPGVIGFPGGNDAGSDDLPGGNAPGDKPNKITPAREFAGAADFPPDSREFPGGSAAAVPAVVPVPVPVPAAAGRKVAAAAKSPPIPAKADLLASEYPLTQGLLEQLAARGWILVHAGADRRRVIETALGTPGVPEAALAFLLDDLETRAQRQQEIPGSIGFYPGDISALAKRMATPEPSAPPVPILDLAWLDQLPEPARAEAHAAWTAKAAEVEGMFAPAAVPHILASSAEVLRQQFTRNSEATA